MVSPQVELLITLSSNTEVVYIVDKKIYQDMRIDKMTDPGGFDINQYLQKEAAPAEVQNPEVVIP